MFHLKEEGLNDGRICMEKFLFFISLGSWCLSCLLRMLVLLRSVIFLE